MHADTAADILAANRYMTLATADAEGTPWASPVWFATEDHHALYWVSDPGARHSRNFASRPELAIVVFDSRVAPGTGTGVYMEARAAQLAGEEAAAGIAIFSRESLAQGMSGWTPADVSGPARLRLYRADVARHHLGEHDRRTVVALR